MQEQIEADLKKALLAGDKTTTSTLKMLKSSLQNKQIDKGGPLSDDEVLATVRAEAKKRSEAIEMYVKGGRSDQADIERAELDILEKYLPAQLSDEQLQALVDEVKNELGDDAAMGQLIQTVIKQAEGRVDGKRVADVVRQSL